MDYKLFKKHRDLRDLQKELAKEGELVNESTTVTGHEMMLGQALVDAGIKVNSHYMLDGREFDFKLTEYPIIIEVDGVIHEYKRDVDYKKDRMAQIRGYKVLRYTNEEVKNPQNIVDQVKSCMANIHKQNKLVYVYPFSVGEQIKYWWRTKILKQKDKVISRIINKE